MRIAIVGAGLIGLSTAYFLSREGFEVTVYDRRKNVGLETSFGNAGLLSPSISPPWNGPGAIKQLLKSLYHPFSPLTLHLSTLPSLLGFGKTFLTHSRESRFLSNATTNIALCIYSLELMQSLFEEHGFQIEKGHGTLMIFRRQRSFDIAKRHYETFKQLEFETLATNKIAEIEPALKDIDKNVVGGFYYPLDQYGNAHLFCEQLAAICRKQGVVFKFNTPIQALSKQNQIITGLQTPDGIMQHDKYVLSAGSHCLPLCQSINLKLPVRPVKGYSITAPISNRMKRPTVAVRDYDIHTAITPIGNTLRVAGTAEFSGFSNALKEKRLQHLLKLLHLTYPRAIMPFTPTKKLQPWAGLRPMSADGVPIISHSTFHNLYLNTGHGPLGWTAAAASGRLLTDILQKKRSLLPIEAYSIKRF